jgi:hypothetical protein
MSARDEQPATVPPPPGEDDAYSAATKVGAMPAEVMARLRAEGLLPEEPEGCAVPPLPAVSLPPRSSPEPPEEGDVPSLYSSVPPALGAGSLHPPPSRPLGPETPGPIPVRPSKAPILPQIRLDTPSSEIEPRRLASDAPAGEGTMETPIAFAAPPASVSAHPPVLVSAPEVFELREDVRGFGRGGRPRRLLVLVALGIVLVVAFAFAMALMSQRR